MTKWENNGQHFGPTIETRVWFNSPLDGGRYSACSAGYCPHLVVKAKETMWGVRLMAVTQSPVENLIRAGDEAVTVWALMFFGPNCRYDELVRGATFQIREGPRAIGTGVVLSDFEW